MSSTRQLAAIMFTDIVGYTALMGKDEKQAFELLKKNRELHKPLIKQYHGNWIKELGDGVLASFQTVTDAVYCAAAIHNSCKSVEGLQLRIGIHLGEVIFENNDVFGDGVNIASRLQAMASPGTTWVSEAIYKTLVNKKEISSEFIKEETLKNVSEPVKVYEITVKEIPGYLPDNIKAYQSQSGIVKSVKKKAAYILGAMMLIGLIAAYLIFFNPPAKRSINKSVITEKSIAVLPFKNMSEEKANQHFADGMMDEILNKLSKIKDLRVIARTSVEQYRDTKKSIKEIAKELGVAYILEGSAQKYGEEIKVIVQLIKAESEGHAWADNYIRPYKEVFVLQNEIAGSIVKELQATLTSQENQLVNKLAATNTEAYDFYLRGKEHLISFYSIQSVKELSNARDMFHKALQIDSSLAQAWVGLGEEYWNRNWQTTEFLQTGYLDSVLYYCNKAISLDAYLPEAYEIRGRYYQYRAEFDKDIDDQQKAISINPNSASAYWNLSWDYHAKRDYLKSLTYFTKARKLITSGALLPVLLSHTSQAYISIGYFNAADSLLDKAIQLNPESPLAYNMYRWSLTQQGKLEKALFYAQKTVEITSNSYDALSNLSDAYSFLKDFKNALTYFDKAEVERKKEGNIRINTAHRAGYILWHNGKKDEAKKYFDDQIKTLEEAVKLGRSRINYYDLAATYAFLGEDKKAIHYLREYEKEGFNAGLEYYIMVDPLFESLRSNKEFKEIIEKAQAQKAEIRKQVKEMELKGEL